MKASELIQKLLELTVEAGKDLDVVTRYEDMFVPEIEYRNVYLDEIKRAPASFENDKEVIVIS